MPKIHELIDNVAAHISNDSIGEKWSTKLVLKLWFTNLDFPS